jgi:hypothetical protein
MSQGSHFDHGLDVGIPSDVMAEIKREAEQREARELLMAEAAIGAAENLSDQLIAEMAEYDSQLDPSKEVALRLAGMSTDEALRVRDVSFVEPHAVVIHGEDADGQPARLVQNLAQLNFLLVALNRTNPEKPKDMARGIHAAARRMEKRRRKEPS